MNAGAVRMMLAGAVLCGFSLGTVLSVESEGRKPGDPTGILRKPIPDRLVVLTFDDGCASGYTVVAPILKSLGFGGSFYVCDFDSFRTRKDWYLTWRQMRDLAAQGFEVGNHTVGHAGGANIDSFHAMEDQALAHGVPQMTTVAWPVHQVNPKTFPDLAAQGYSFGRSGHNRVYRPTIDNSYDIPSMGASNLEDFAKVVRQAVDGKIVTICFHGVPDGEHPQVGLAPATFEEMMQYLKENDYKVIALRDLGEYIDSAKAGKLAPTSDKDPFPDAGETVQDDKPPACKDIKSFGFPNLSGASIFQTQITAHVPFGTDVTALAPQITVSEGASVEPAADIPRDFTKPLTYTVTGRNGAQKVFTVTVHTMSASDRKNMLKIGFPGDLPTIVSGTDILVCVPANFDVQGLPPTFALSPFAKASPPSGTPLNLSQPQKITVTAQDGSTQVYTIAAAKAGDVKILNWHRAASGNWSDDSNWQMAAGEVAAPAAEGRADYVLHFGAAGNYETANDLTQGFRLNRLCFATGQGQNLKLTGSDLTLTANRAAGIRPAIEMSAIGQRGVITNPLELTGDVAVNMSAHSELTLEGRISGDGRLVLNSTDPNPSLDNYHYMACRLRVDGKGNTYRGGTVIHSGRFMLFSSNRGLGSGPVTLHENGRIWIVIPQQITNPLTAHGGLIEGDGSWNAPVTLSGELKLAGNLTFPETGGGLRGPGGLTMIGAGGHWGWVNERLVFLCGTNTYSGRTTVVRGTLCLQRPAALYGGDPSQWTPANISVHAPGTLRLCVGGQGEFTGEQASRLLNNLTAGIDNDGLLGGSFFSIDTGHAAGPVTMSANIADSQGPGGGWFFFRKVGAGALELTGANTYTGQTSVEDGTLIVSSLNRVAGGRPSSSLGAPTTPEAGTLEMAADCGLTYTGKGEATDRILDLTGGQPQTVTLDQSGSGLLKLTSDIVYSGYGHSKTIGLKGSTAGSGEIAGRIANPYDRKGAATTAVIKTGTGTWTLSGDNRYTGPTTVSQGTLVLTSTRSLGANAEIYIADGAQLELRFQGELPVRKLTLGGVVQPAGAYRAANASKFLEGTGVLKND